MIDEIIFIYNSDEDKDTINGLETSRPIAFDMYDYRSKLSKRKAREIMEEWGIRQLPAALLKENNKIIKILYTEDKNRVLTDIKEFI